MPKHNDLSLMDWYKIVFTDDHIAEGFMIKVQQQFSRLHADLQRPVDLALFYKGESLDLIHTFYLPPAAKHYCPDLLKTFDAKPTSKPSRANLKLLSGRSDAMTYFFQAKA